MVQENFFPQKSAKDAARQLYYKTIYDQFCLSRQDVMDSIKASEVVLKRFDVNKIIPHEEKIVFLMGEELYLGDIKEIFHTRLKRLVISYVADIIMNDNSMDPGDLNISERERVFRGDVRFELMCILGS